MKKFISQYTEQDRFKLFLDHCETIDQRKRDRMSPTEYQTAKAYLGLIVSPVVICLLTVLIAIAAAKGG